MFNLTDADKASIRKFFIAKMKTMSEDKWAYWSMDQDGWEEDMCDSMDPVQFILMQWACEDEGVYPNESVAEFLASLEIEVYGREVCC